MNRGRSVLESDIGPTTMLLVLVVLSGLLFAQPATAPVALLLRGGEVYDGSGNPPQRVDIRIAGDSIVEIGEKLAERPGERVIDVKGKAVAPGFIDVHSHADRGLEQMRDAATQLRQGITTAVVGQDGGSELPIAEFFEEIGRIKPAINFASSIGHGTVRAAVMGEDFRRPATTGEIEVMKALVDRGMRDGAIGLSSGLEYDPGFYSKIDELVALAQSIAPYGGLYSSHVRDEENHVFEAWREAIDVGRQAGVAVEISHIKLAAKPVWGRAAEAVRLLEDARREGLRVFADWYPYTYWQSSIYVLIPDRDFENRTKWEVGLDEIGGPQNVLVTNYRTDPTWNGQTIAELAAKVGKDPISLIIDMIHADGPNIGIIGTSMDEADLAKFVAHPQVLICSDGGLRGAHPRGYGAFPRVLARYVRERQALPLTEAIAKMTGRSAEQLGITDRGQLVVGRKADVVVFDPVAVLDTGLPRDPAREPIGIETVVVNGEVVLDAGKVTAARPGRPLKRTRR